MEPNTMQGQHSGWQQPLPQKSFLVAILLSVLVGTLGVDRFYLGHIGMGIGKIALTFLSFGFLGWIWWIIDVILIATRKVNSENFVWDDQIPPQQPPQQGYYQAPPPPQP